MIAADGFCIFAPVMTATSLDYRYIWKLTYPVMLGMLAQNLINFTDTVFLGRVGEVELGASAIGGLFYYGVFVVGFGFSIGTQILISRRNGEHNNAEIGRIFNHSLGFLLLLGLLIVVLVQTTAPALLQRTMSSHAVYQATWAFLDIRVWGIFFAFINASFRAFYVGTLKTWMLGWSAGIMAVVNIILNYLLIFGNFGFPRMGIAGSALASVISEAVSVVFFVIISLYRKDILNYGILKPAGLQWKVIRSTLELSVYTMIQNFLAMGGWLFFFMIIERSGEHPLAISNIARSIYIILMIPLWAFGTTTNTLVSNLMGEKRQDQVMGAIRKISLMSFLITSGLVAIAAFFPYQILSLYTTNQKLIHDAVPVIYVVFGALIAFSAVITVYSGVTGTGNTFMGMIIEVVTILVYVIFAFVVVQVLRQPVTVAWFAEFVYFTIMGSLSFLYLRYGKWRSIKI